MFNKHGWEYHTYINPLNNGQDPLSKAFNKFLNELLLEKDFILSELSKVPYKVLIIDTNEEHDNIKIGAITFLKSRFLTNKKFKQNLVDYYNAIGIFVKGPTEYKKRDNISMNKWIIELSLIN